MKKNQQSVFYANYASHTDKTDEYGNETGEVEITYTTPTEVKVNKGKRNRAGYRTDTSNLQMYGLTQDYTYVLQPEGFLDVDESTVWWIDRATTEPYNFVTTLVQDSLDSQRIYVKEVSVG